MKKNFSESNNVFCHFLELFKHFWEKKIFFPKNFDPYKVSYMRIFTLVKYLLWAKFIHKIYRYINKLINSFIDFLWEVFHQKLQAIRIILLIFCFLILKPSFFRFKNLFWIEKQVSFKNKVYNLLKSLM